MTSRKIRPDLLIEHGERSTGRSVIKEVSYDRKLDRALRDSFTYKLSRRIATKSLYPEEENVRDYLRIPFELDDFVTDETAWGLILRFALGDSPYDPEVVDPDVIKTVKRASLIAMDNVKLQVNVNIDIIPEDYQTRLRLLMQNWSQRQTLDTEISRLFQLASHLGPLVRLSQCYRYTQGKSESYHAMKLRYWKNQYHRFIIPGYELILTREHCYLVTTQGSIYIMPHDLLLLWHNKTCDVISTLLASKSMSGVSLQSNFYDHVIEFIKCGISILLTYKYNAFAVFKALEAFCTGETLVTLEGPSNSGFLSTIANDLKESTRFDYFQSDLRMLIRQLPIPERHEISCLSKLFGHPFVRMIAGAQSLYDKTTEQQYINIYHVNLVSCFVKENFVRNYILKHGCWPPVTLELMSDDHPLKRAHQFNRQPSDPFITRRYGEVKIEDYNRVTLLKCLDFDRLENALPYLKDRTISVLRSNVWNTYIDESRKRDAQVTWRDTRLLLAYLLNPSSAHDHLQYLRDYESSTDFEDLLDYLIIRVVPKERELKDIFRGFGCKSYEDRLRSICQEYNVMEFLQHYSDEQAMTITELELEEKLVAFRQLEKAYPRHRILNIVIDASAWNNKFRAETVHPVMSCTLDAIFGTSIYSKTHLAYQKSLVYVPDSAGTSYWYGQDGGIEGLNQDTWVVTYIAQIKSALASIEFPYHILCKGDDVRVCFAIPPTVYERIPMAEIRDDLVNRLATTLGKLGHTIKTQESYGSSCYFAFSKAASVHSIELPQTLRKIQKVYGATNAFVATLDEYVGSAFSNAHSACKVSTQTCSQFYVAGVWSMWHILCTEGFKELTNTELLSLLLVPNMLGGYPIIYLYNMAVRAESDLLPPFLAIYEYLRQRRSGLAKILERFMRSRINAVTERKMLLTDPYCLPIVRPESPSTKLRKIIKASLFKITRREEIREILSLTEEESSQTLIEVLLSARPFHVKILSVMYAATPEGVLTEIVRKFESCRSVMELVITRGGLRMGARVARMVIKAERTLQKWRVMRIKGENLTDDDMQLPYDPTKCLTENAWIWREKAWGIEIHGITQPPLQHIMRYTEEGAYGTDKWADKNHFFYHLRPPISAVDPEHVSHYSTGLLRPFLGHTTRTGTIAPQARLDQTENILVKVSNLLDLTSWLKPEGTNPVGEYTVPNGLDVIKVILGIYTSRTLEEFLPLTATSRGSGTIQHHVRAPSFRESIVPNTLINAYTRFIGESDTHRTMKDGGEHYLYNFLHGYCHTLWLMNLNAEFTNELWTHAPWWGITVNCQFCMAPILETPMVFDTRRLQNIRFYPLTVTQIGQVSLKKMEAAIETLEPSKYSIRSMTEDISLENAGMAVLHDIVDNLYYRRLDIARRFGDTAFNDEALRIYTSLAPKSKRRDVGKGELRRIPTRTLYEFVVAEAHLHLMSIIRDAEVDYIPTIMSTVEATTLPWYGLCNLLLAIGRLAHLVHYIQIKSNIPAPVCFNRAQTAALYIGSASLYADLKFLSNLPILITTGVELSRSRPLVARQVYLAMARMLLTDFFIHLEHVPMGGVASDDQISLWIQALWVLYAMEDCNIVADDIISHLGQTGANSICLCNFLRFQADDWAYILDDRMLLMNRACIISQRLKSSGILLVDITRIPQERAEVQLDLMIEHFQKYVIKCQYAALPACINRLRTAKVVQSYRMDTLDDEDKEEPEYEEIPDDDETVMSELERSAVYHQDRAQFYVRQRSAISQIICRNCRIKLLDSYDVSTVDLTVHNNKFVTDYVMFDVGRTFRLIGTEAGTETTCVELLAFLGSPEIYEDQIWCCCLADGVGGFTSGLLYRYPKAQIVFHTRPDAVLDNPAPHAALNAHPDMTRQIHWDHLIEGHVSLSRLSTYRALESKKHVYHYICCDLEFYLKGEADETEDAIYEYVVSFVIRNSAVNCIYFLRVNMNRADLCCKIASSLASHSSYLGLYKPRALKEGPYAYLVGIIARPSIEREYHIPLIAYHQVSVGVCKLIDRYSGTFNKLVGLSNITLDWEQLLHSTFRRGIAALNTNRAYYIMSTTYHVSEETMIMQRLARPFSTEKGMWRAVRAMMSDLISLHDPRNVLLKIAQTESYDTSISLPKFSYATHSHIIVLMLNQARYNGFFEALMYFVNTSHTERLQLSGTQIWQWFKDWWQKLPLNLRLTTSVDDHLKYDYKINDMPASLYRPFMKGTLDAVTVYITLLLKNECL